jgi:hypothetical protein
MFWALLFLSPAEYVLSQPLKVEWTRRLGGASNDDLTVVRQVAGSGYIIGGTSESGPSGTKTSPRYGGTDMWAVRLSPTGDQLWDKSFGGAIVFPPVEGYDYLNTIVPAVDGGFLLLGETSDSTGGSKTAGGHGSWDMYAVRIDAVGTQIWDKTYGSAGLERGVGGAQTPDGGFVLVGGTDKNGSYDVYITRIDANGSQLWERTYGGTGADMGVAIVQTSDGGFFVAADSASPPSGNKTSPFYGGGFYFSEWAGDFWLLRLDSDGNKIFEQTFGGSSDEAVYDFQPTLDGGVVIAGASLSPPDGNKTSTNGSAIDGWIVRIDSFGQKLWEKTLGGFYTAAAGIRQLADGGFIVLSSTNGAPSLTRLDELGNTLWQQSFPAPDHTIYMSSLDRTTDGGFVIGGLAITLDGIGFGQDDFVVMKLSAEPPRLIPVSRGPTVASQGFNFKVLSPPGNCVVEWSTNMSNWMPLQTNLSDGTLFSVLDTDATNSPQRFYRARTN